MFLNDTELMVMVRIADPPVWSLMSLLPYHMYVHIHMYTYTVMPHLMTGLCSETASGYMI